MSHEEGGLTAAELVANAKRRRLEPVSERLVGDWVEMGLLANPTRQGAGRGHGSRRATFSANQHELFIALLRQRAKLAQAKEMQRALPRSARDRETRIALLARIPLVLWTYWGDDYVDTRQARKALATSLDVQTLPRERATKRAKSLVDAIAHADASPTAINRLRRILEASIVKGRIEDPSDFDRTFRRVFDPYDHNRQMLPPGVSAGQSASPSSLLQAEVLRERARTALLTGAVTEELLEQARTELQVSFVEYAREHPLYVALSGQRLMDVAVHNEFEKLINTVTDDIWFLLGVLLRDQPKTTEKKSSSSNQDEP
jgi:hypothetical protein